MVSCLQWFEAGSTTDGFYEILLGGTKWTVYCDMQNGGWTRVLNAVPIDNQPGRQWSDVAVDDAGVKAGRDQSDDTQNGWIPIQFWSTLATTGEMFMTCHGSSFSGGTYSNQAVEREGGAFTLGGEVNAGDYPDANWYRINWNIGGNWASLHNGYSLSTAPSAGGTDRSRYSNCPDYTGHESAGWGWHNHCHIGSPWIGGTDYSADRAKGVYCQIRNSCSYGGTACYTPRAEWFVK